MNIPYSEKVVGEIYYCVSPIGNEYIFQAVDYGSSKSLMFKKDPSDTRKFNEDWKEDKDRELRLATPEEKAFFYEEFGMEIPSSYQIY